MHTRCKLRQWRESNDLTLEDVSDLLGGSPSISMLSRIERDERQLAILERVRLSRALGVKVRDLFETTTDAPLVTEIDAAAVA